MRPAQHSVVGEIIGVSLWLHASGCFHIDAVLKALAFCVGDSFLLGVKPQLKLCDRLTAAGPTHDGVGFAGFGRFIFKQPLF